MQTGQKSVNLKYSLVLTGMLRLKPASQHVQRYHSVVSCALNMEELISKNVCKFSKQLKSKVKKSKAIPVTGREGP
jgi:ABC-type Na+ transport system ATPase subunit NatA